MQRCSNQFVRINPRISCCHLQRIGRLAGCLCSGQFAGDPPLADRLGRQLGIKETGRFAVSTEDANSFFYGVHGPMLGLGVT